MRRSLVVFFLVVLLFSCSKESFSVDSSSLTRIVKVAIDTNGDVLSCKERVELAVIFSNSELGYSFLIKSPSGDLAWEGGLSGGSNELGITEGASFPSGFYHVIFYADNGTELNSEIKLSKKPDFYPYINESRELVSSFAVDIVEYDVNNNTIAENARVDNGYRLSEECTHVIIKATDRYLNQLEITESLLQ